MIRFEKTQVSPSLAKRLLSTMKSNRHVSQATVSKYAAAMRSTDWLDETGETIKVSNEGNLIDGQHRLLAVIKADTVVPMIVASGIENECFKVIDSGMKRRPVDVLSIHDPNIKNKSQVTGAINYLLAFFNGSFFSHQAFSSVEILDFYKENPVIQSYVAEFKNIHRQLKSISVSYFAALIFLCSDEKKDDLKRFFKQIVTGENLERGDAALTIRNYLVNHQAVSGYSFSRMMNRIILNGWNKYSTGKKMFRLNEETPEKFMFCKYEYKG